MDPLSALPNLCSSQSIAGAFYFFFFFLHYFKDAGEIGMGKRVPQTGSSSLGLLPCFSIGRAARTEPPVFHTCSFGGAVGFSVIFSSACPVWQRGITCHLHVSPSHGVSYLISVHLVDVLGSVEQGGFVKFPDTSQEQNFPCASQVDLAPAGREYWTCTCPFSIGWVLWSCGWLNKHVSFTRSSSRLLVTAVQDPNEPQAATNPSFDCQADTGKLSCETPRESSLSLPVTVNEQQEKWGTAAAVTEGIAVLPACTQSRVAFPHGVAISVT